MSKDLQINHFLTTNQPFKTLEVFEYRLQEEEYGFRRLMALANALTNNGRIVIPISGGILSTRMIPNLQTNHPFLFHDRYTLSSSSSPILLKKFAESWFRDHSRRKGFTLNEQGMMFSKHYEKKKKVRIYDGCKYSVSVLPSGQVVVVLDPKQRYFQEFNQFLQNNPHFLSGTNPTVKVKVPSSNTMSWISGRYVGTTTMRARDKVKGKDKSFVDVWSESRKNFFCKIWDLNIRPNDPIDLIQIGPNIRLHYPRSVLRVPINLKRLGQRPGRIPKTQHRLDDTMDLATRLLTPISRTDGLEFDFNASLLIEPQFPTYGYQNGILQRPKIAYSGSNGMPTIRQPTKDSDVVGNLKTFGPYSEKIDLSSDIIVIKDESESLLGSAHQAFNQLARSYTKCHLGNIKLGKIHEITYLNQAQLRKELKDLDYSDTPSDGRPFALVVLACGQNRDIYIQAKRSMTLQGLPSKMITQSTLGALIGNNSRQKSSTLQIISLQMYARSLYPGESALLLANPSSGPPEGSVPVVLTMDISRDEEHDEYGVAEITAFSGQGILLSATSKRRFREKQFNPKMVIDWFIDTVHDASGLAKKLSLPEPNAFIFMYDGAMNSVQVQVLEEAADEALRQMVAARILPKGSDYAMVEVTKNVTDRIYWGRSKPKIGSYMIDPLGFGYLVASKPYRGSPKLLRCAIRVQSEGYMSIKGLLQFVHDLRHLTPTSPWTQPRDPTPKYLAHNNSNLSRMGIDPPYIPF